MADQKGSLRQLYILQYLYEQTDEEHPATTADIIAYLSSNGISAHRQTVSEDIVQLVAFGIDIITERSRQNRYFYGSRLFELAELKMMVDAIQAARFITPGKSKKLIKKLSALTDVHHAAELDRQLFLSGVVKATNERILYTVNTIYEAISTRRQLRFKYYEYTAEKKKVFKHKGQVYAFSPYDLVWHNDTYYVFGWSKSHGKVIKFRVDRIHQPKLTGESAHPKPEDYDLTAYIKRTFSMYEDEDCTVELLCENRLMKSVVDRFGEDVQVRQADSGHFIATVEVSVSPTFFAWVFTFAGEIKILSPKSVADRYIEQLTDALKTQ